jgi:hypothetical protein
MTRNFPGSNSKNEYSAYRNTKSQVLKEIHGSEVVYNKRKLNEFPNIINQIQSESIKQKVGQDNFYKDMLSPKGFTMIRMELALIQIGLVGDDSSENKGLFGLFKNVPKMLENFDENGEHNNVFQELNQEMFYNTSGESNFVPSMVKNMPDLLGNIIYFLIF